MGSRDRWILFLTKAVGCELVGENIYLHGQRCKCLQCKKELTLGNIGHVFREKMLCDEMFCMLVASVEDEDFSELFDDDDFKVLDFGDSPEQTTLWKLGDGGDHLEYQKLAQGMENVDRELEEEEKCQKKK